MRLSILMASLVGGCTWVTPADVDGRRGDVDDDQDGYIAREDCDDNNADVSPGAEEVWYDGLDADCLKDDDYDADRDGFVPSQYIGLATGGATGTGLLPGGDCDDSNKNAYPGATDVIYDGVDSDCGGEDDFDQDGDGYVDDNNVGLTTQYADGTGALPGGDCDDADSTVNPGAADAFYDGVDSDCGGEDDFDQDADGYVATENVGKPTLYAPSAGGLPGDDCNDEDGAINPVATEIWYDGIDQNCGGDDDYDVDRDGYVPDGLSGRATEGVDGSGALPDGDCDDADGQVNPGQLEIISDPRDLDCDQGGDPSGSASFTARALDGYSGWDRPFAPRFAENVSGVFLSMATYAVTSGTRNYFDTALAVSFDPNDPLAGVVDEYAWFRNSSDPPSFDLTAGHDIVLTNEYLFGVTGLVLGSQRSFRLGGFDLIDGTAGLTGRVFSTSETTEPFSDISITLDDDGTMYAVGCDAVDGVLQYMEATVAGATEGIVDIEALLLGVPASTCELSLRESSGGLGLLWTNQSDTLVIDEYNLGADPPVLSRRSGNAAIEALDIDILDTAGEPVWQVIADPDAIFIIDDDDVQYTVAVGESPSAVRASVAPNGDLVIAYVDGNMDAHVLYGDPDAGLDQVDIQVSFGATEAAAWVESTGTSLLVAVLGATDVAYGAAAL